MDKETLTLLWWEIGCCGIPKKSNNIEKSSEELIFEYSSETKEPLRIEINSVSGTLYDVREIEFISADMHPYKFDIKDLPVGVYSYKITLKIIHIPANL